jgi:hypothetical protein
MRIVSIGCGKTKSLVRKKKGGKRKTRSERACAEKNADVREHERSAAISTPVSAKDARDEVEGLIRKEAGAMTQAIIEAVKEGQFGQMKYLFEISGIYPAVQERHEIEREESVTARLLRELDEWKEGTTIESSQSGRDGNTRDQGSDAIE